MTSTGLVITSVKGTFFNHGVWIGEPCNGVKIFGLFTLFILAFPGSWKKKLWFIPLGIFIVHTANAIRIALLTIMSAENPKALDFNHNITFQVIVYGLNFPSLVLVGSEIIGDYTNQNQVNKSLKITLLFILGFILFYSDFMRDYVFQKLRLPNPLSK